MRLTTKSERLVFSAICALVSCQLLLPVKALTLGSQSKPSQNAKDPQGNSANQEKAIPTGTMLIPLEPKIEIDDNIVEQIEQTVKRSKKGNKKLALADAANKVLTVPKSTGAKPNSTEKPALLPLLPEGQLPATLGDLVDIKTVSGPEALPASKPTDGELMSAPDTISAEQGEEDPSIQEEIGEDTTLKGTIQLVADDTEYDQEKNTFLGTGNAVVTIAGEDSKLEADTILYDQTNQMIDARGNVRIYRDGQLTTGSSFKFKVTSDEYLIKNPDTEVQGTEVIARTGLGNKAGMLFQNGTMKMPQVIHMANNAYFGPLSFGEEISQRILHPDAYVPAKQSFKFKARKMVYERYKDQGNFTIFGGRLVFGHFSIPIPKFTATINSEIQNAVMPITPVLGNNLNMGGISIGPSFNRSMGKTGVFSAAPLVQIGGRSLDSSSSNSGSVGIGARLVYTDKHINSHLAYGSVSNLLVGDFIYKFNPQLKFQSGINRFLDDGIFGLRRARYIGEVVNMKVIGSVPYISMLTFRSSAGWAKDNPQLLTLTPKFAELFTQPTTTTVQPSAFRLQEQITAATNPLFVLGDRKVGASGYLYGGLGLRAYSSGNAMAMAQAGPIVDLFLNRARMQFGYFQSKVKGSSPFVFDQFIQGSRSCSVGGDVKLCQFLTLGANAGYNLDAKLLYQRSVTAAVGPQDFKMLFSYDTLRKNNRYGFDFLFGQPIPFQKLLLKGSPDHGQLGGI